MRSVSIARTGLSTSRLGFGTSQLHLLPTPWQRQALLAKAWDGGIRYFDTAPLYGHRMAERELGAFFAHRAADAVVATKFGIPSNPLFARAPLLMYAGKALRRITGSAPKWLRDLPRGNYGIEELRSSLESSLRNLRRERIEILYLHEPRLEDLAEADRLIAELYNLKKSGKVGSVGLSGLPAECVPIASRHPALAEVMQVEVTPESAGVADGLDPDVTFGHFRVGLRQASQEAACSRVQSIMAHAVRINPDGVILFSSRSASRVEAVVKTLDAIEGPCELR